MKLSNETFCPYCNYKVQCATCVEDKDRQVEPNSSLSLCINCSEISIYSLDENNNLCLRFMSEDEEKEFKKNESIVTLANNVKKMINKIKKEKINDDFWTKIY